MGTRDGTNAQPNDYGIRINGTGNVIGGDSASDRNLISGNDQLGIIIYQGGNNTIKGNYIGTDASGESALPNSGGIAILESSGNIVGGSQTDSNLLSGNTVCVPLHKK